MSDDTIVKPELELPDQATMMQLVDILLKSPNTIYQHIVNNDFQQHWLKLFLIFSACILFYGVIVGSFSGHVQWFAAPLKVWFTTCFSGLLCFPSFYILSCLSGADLRPHQLMGLLLGSFTLISILLIGFTPIVFIFTFSIQSLAFMGIIHIVVWVISLRFGLRFLRDGLVSVGSNDLLIDTWVFMLVLTLLQMSTSLRPILGESDTLFTSEKVFFLEHWFHTFINRKW